MRKRATITNTIIDALVTYKSLRRLAKEKEYQKRWRFSESRKRSLRNLYKQLTKDVKDAPTLIFSPASLGHYAPLLHTINIAPTKKVDKRLLEAALAHEVEHSKLKKALIGVALASDLANLASAANMIHLLAKGKLHPMLTIGSFAGLPLAIEEARASLKARKKLKEHGKYDPIIDKFYLAAWLTQGPRAILSGVAPLIASSTAKRKGGIAGRLMGVGAAEGLTFGTQMLASYLVGKFLGGGKNARKRKAPKTD